MQPTLPLAGLEPAASSSAVMDKRTEQTYIRLPWKLKKFVKSHAKKHLRSFNETCLYLIAKGLHADNFTTGAYLEEFTDDDESAES